MKRKMWLPVTPPAAGHRHVTKIMTELTASEREALLVSSALPKRQRPTDVGSRCLLLLVCCVSMIAWLGFLGWGFGHLIRVW